MTATARRRVLVRVFAFALFATSCGGGSTTAEGSDDVQGDRTAAAVANELCIAARATVGTIDFPTTVRELRKVGSDTLYPTLNSETASPIRKLTGPDGAQGMSRTLGDAILAMVANMDNVLDEMLADDPEAALVHLDESADVLGAIDDAGDALGAAACTGAALSGSWYDTVESMLELTTTRTPSTGDFVADATAACEAHEIAFMTPDVLQTIVTDRGESVSAFAPQQEALERLRLDLESFDRPEDERTYFEAVDRLDDAAQRIEQELNRFRSTGNYDGQQLLFVIETQELAATALAELGVTCGPFHETGYFFTGGPEQTTTSTTSTTTPPPTTTSTLPGPGAFDAPIPRGTPQPFVATFGDIDGATFTLTITGPAVDQTDFAKENDIVFGDPGDGFAFVSIPVSLTLESSPRAPVDIGASLGIAMTGASSGRSVGDGVETLCSPMIPDKLDLRQELNAGDTISGTICITMARSILEEGVLLLIQRTDTGRMYFDAR